jgi:hypothetical protein
MPKSGDPEAKRAPSKSDAGEKEKTYSESVECGQQPARASYEREAIDYERDAHRPQVEGKEEDRETTRKSADLAPK